MKLLCIIALAAILSGCGDSKEIKFVKSGKLVSCPNKTMEQAAKGFFGSPKWKSGVSKDGRVFVDIQGKMSVHDKEVDAVLQFIVDEKKGTFEAHPTSVCCHQSIVDRC